MCINHAARAHVNQRGVWDRILAPPPAFLARPPLPVCRWQDGGGGCVGSVARARLSGTRAVQRFTLGLCLALVCHVQLGRGFPAVFGFACGSASRPAGSWLSAAVRCRLAKVIDLWLLCG